MKLVCNATLAEALAMLDKLTSAKPPQSDRLRAVYLARLRGVIQWAYGAAAVLDAALAELNAGRSLPEQIVAAIKHKLTDDR